MPQHDAPPSAGPDQLVDDMLAFLRGGALPEPSGAEPDASRDGTRSWAPGAVTADGTITTPNPAGLPTIPDRVLGPYLLGNQLGGGGMGEVFRARHRDLQQVVALKRIRHEYAGDPATRARFLTEAKAAASLDHPNVVQVYGFDIHEGEMYLVMELAPNGTLAHRLRDDGPMPPRPAAALVRALAGAMAYAHGKGVVHRDLKPGNVLIAADGTPKVADFGLARLLTEDQNLTRTGAILGTAAYMAPEQADGRAADFRTDVYALGAILYEVLTGRPLFTGETNEAVLKQVKESAPPRPSSVAAGVSADLEAVCLRCLSKHANDRYQTAAALAEDLDRFLSGEPLAPGPWLRARQAARAVRKRWRWAGVGGLCAASAAVVFWATRPPGDPNGESAAVREELEAELRAGRPVTLVGAKGWPKWFRWRTDASADRRVTLAPDGVASVEVADAHAAALLELLPDSVNGNYKVTAKVRHEWSKPAGRVGVYVGHHTYPWEPHDLHVFTAVRFNGVVGHPGLGAPRPTEPTKLKWVVPENSAAVDLDVCLLTDFGDLPDRDTELAGKAGKRITPRGDRSGQWHEVELTVTPDGVTGVLDGDQMPLTAAKVREVVPKRMAQLRSKQPGDSPFARLAPEYRPRGGVGLYIKRGGVGLRDVTVTPLPD